MIGSNELFYSLKSNLSFPKKNLMKDKIISIMMKLIRLTPDNVRYYIGYEILFKSRGKHIVKVILDMSKSGGIKKFSYEKSDL